MKKKRHRLGLIFTILLLFLSLGHISSVKAENNNPTVIRYSGSNREIVAVNVARGHFINSNKVIIVNRDKFPDAISATNISQGKYPVLYTREGRLDQQTINLLNEMPLNEIYILGGTNSVGETVVTELAQKVGVKVTRIDGKDRFIVNTKAIQLHNKANEHVVIASGDIYTDALYGVSYANTIDAPVILAKKDHLTEETVALLKQLRVKKVTLIGGQNTLTLAVENQLRDMGIQLIRIAGANRYSGSTEVASASYSNPDSIVIASGEVFSDALVSAPLAQKLNAPILLVRKSGLDKEVSTYLKANKVSLSNIYIQGGPGTITLENEANITAAVVADPPIVTDVIFSETIPAPTEVIIQHSDEMFVGEEEATREAQAGSKNITTRITYVDGKEISRVVIKEEVIKEALAGIVVHGRKEKSKTVIDISNENLTEEEIYSRAKDSQYKESEIINNYIYPKRLSNLEKSAVNSGNIINEVLLNQYFLELVNTLRKDVGVKPLMSDPTLSKGTNIRSVELAELGTIRPYYIDEEGNITTTTPHSRPYNKEVGSFESFYTAFYYRDDQPMYYLGENLAQYSYEGNSYTINSEQYLAEQFYNQWFNSPGHYANMISADYDGTWLSIAVGDYNEPSTGATGFDGVFGTQILTNNAKIHNE